MTLIRNRRGLALAGLLWGLAPGALARQVPAEALPEEAVELAGGTRALAQTLAPWDAQAGDRFGHAVALDGDWLLCAAPSDDLQGRDSGSVAAYRRAATGWLQTDRLEPDDGHGGDYFGFSLDLAGTVAVVGAPWDDDGGERSGSAYAFEWDGARWRQVAKFRAFDAQPDDRFGHAVACDGTTLVVGARLADEGGRDNGAIYVFERQRGGWVPTAKILSPRVSQGAEFGFSVAVDGDLIAVGAWSDDRVGRDDGSVHLFRRTPRGWEQEAEILAQDRAQGGCFGLSVALEGERCAVGAPWESLDAPRAGAAYVFRYDVDRWVQEQRLRPTRPEPGATFGIAVDLRDDQLLVGVRFGSPAQPGAGAVEVYERRARRWLPEATLALEEGGAGDDFGLAIAAGDRGWAVGAKRADPAGRGAGSGLVRTWRRLAGPPETVSGRGPLASSGNGRNRQL